MPQASNNFKFYKIKDMMPFMPQMANMIPTARGGRNLPPKGFGGFP